MFYADVEAFEKQRARELQERLRRAGVSVSETFVTFVQTNVLKQEFSMTLSQNKAETTFILDSVGN